MTLTIITVPNPALRKKCTPVDTSNQKQLEILGRLAETLIKKTNPQGVGLAAIQVNKDLRAFATYLPPINDFETTTKTKLEPEIKLFINPEILDMSGKLTLGPDQKHPTLEGCLSIPGLYGPVPRYPTVKVKHTSLSVRSARYEVRGKKNSNISAPRTPYPELTEVTEVFSNFFARVIQHEYDHLEGILFTDYTLKNHSPLYFDNGENLIEIPKPQELIKW